MGALSLSALGQAPKAEQGKIPVPEDWSSHHLIFSRPATPEQARTVRSEPRYWYQRYRRELPLLTRASKGSSKKMHRDWAENMGTGAAVGAANYPAKFSFLGTNANCASDTTPDYVTYSTGLTGSATQASIVAFDNLYSGCSGTVPSVYWAYNTSPLLGSAQILTSPVLSRDGSQIAFVQTAGGIGSLVLLKWASSLIETVTSPLTLVPVLPAAYPACVAPCMTTLVLRDGLGVATDDTTSSVFYDYANDVAWVGGARGWLHKITPVFNGVPAEISSGGFPVQVNTGNPLSSPVYDRTSRNVFVGDAGGFLYNVNASTGASVASSQLDFGAGIVLGPVVDVTSGLVYAFASSDGTGGGILPANAGVFVLSDTFGSGATGTEVSVGTSTVFGVSTPNPMYIGGFDSLYENSTNGTGNLYVCGNTGANPTLYQIPIAAGVMGASVKITALTPLADTPSCSPVTDVFNANNTGGTEERIFVSVQNNGVSKGCSSGGCIMNFVNLQWQPTTAYATGQQILDNKGRIEVVVTGGTSGASINWTNGVGITLGDGTVTWINQSSLSAVTPPLWQAGHLYPKTLITDNNGNIEISLNSGTSGGTQPSWSMTIGSSLNDNGITWVNGGPPATFALAAAGGTSGIIIDNTVGTGTKPGASQVYFSTLSNQTCGTSGSGGCAEQASQAALQ